MTSLVDMSGALSINGILSGANTLNYMMVFEMLAIRAKAIAGASIALSLVNVEFLNAALNGDMRFVELLDILRRAIVSSLVGSTATTDNGILFGEQEIKDALDKIDTIKSHIPADKHNWHKFGIDPKDPKDWNKIIAIIAAVLANGREESYRSVFKKVLEIGGHIVEVTYQYVDGLLRISDAWVKRF